MGLLDSLNPLSLAKNAAESLVDSVLPDNLKAAGSALADVALDVVSGDYGDLGKDASALLQDAEKALAPLAAELAPALATEPDAPPASDATTAGQAKTAAAATSPATPAASALAAGETAATPAALATTTATTAASSPNTPTTAAAAAATPATAVTTTTVAATPATVAASPATTADATTAAATTASATTATATTTSSSSSDSKDITKFFAQSDADLMAAVRDGKLPDAVKDDPASMQRLQLRMNEISEMNQLISQMLAAMHDMNKAVIQNIRA